MHGDAYGALSLLPPLTAITLAIVTRRVVPSLLIGVAAGALLLEHGNIFAAAVALVRDHLWTSLADPSHLMVFAFTLMLGAMVGIVNQSGGMHGVVQLLAPLARGRRSGQLVTWMLGLLIFFDDYANTLLLGTTMRPLADRLRISREKLAYVVDSTAAPVAGLAIVSTWVAGEIGFIQEGLDNLPLQDTSVDAFQLFIASIPQRFYVIWALLFVPLIAWMNRDFGPMLAAERRAVDRGNETDVAISATEKTDDQDFTPQGWHNAVVPVLVVVGVTTGFLIATGARSLAGRPEPPGWIECFTKGNSYVSLLYGSLAGLMTAVFLVRLQGILTFRTIARGAWSGTRQIGSALLILWLAWALSAMTDESHLATGVYVGGLLEGLASAVWLPTLVFVLSAFVAFATGTSWGTMGILMPLVVDVTYRILAKEPGGATPDDPILLAAIGSVLAGAIFGDHCSPISDTTVLSSQASGCDHVAHVRTQMPYALVVAAVSVAVGTIPIGFGVSVWLLLPAGVAVQACLIYVFGRRPCSASARQCATEAAASPCKL